MSLSETGVSISCSRPTISRSSATMSRMSGCHIGVNGAQSFDTTVARGLRINKPRLFSYFYRPHPIGIPFSLDSSIIDFFVSERLFPLHRLTESSNRTAIGPSAINSCHIGFRPLCIVSGQFFSAAQPSLYSCSAIRVIRHDCFLFRSLSRQPLSQRRFNYELKVQLCLG